MGDSDDDWLPENHVKRKSIAPKALKAPKVTISLYSDKSSEQQAKENIRPSRRVSIAPKTTSTFNADSNLEFQIANHQLSKTRPASTRKSVVPKFVSDFDSDSVEKCFKPSRRKSVAPGPLLKVEKEVNSCTSRRKSVVPKSTSNKETDELNENKPQQKIQSCACLDNKANDPISRKRKSVAPKTASNVAKSVTRNEEKNYPQNRKSVAFKSVLPVHPLQDERNKFEEDIKFYSGDDPLSIWYRYFKWVEQNFLKGGKEGQIVPLMQRCLRTLDDQNRYYNDKRFIEIWLKFASEAKNPVKVYNHMFSRKIGCEFPKLFIDWSSQLELEGNLIQANEILKKGVDCQADPVELKSYWTKFKSRTKPNVVAVSKEVGKLQSEKGSVESGPTKNKVLTEPMVSRNIPPKVCVDDTNADSISRKLQSGNGTVVSEPKKNNVLLTETMVSRNIPPKVSCVYDTNAVSISRKLQSENGTVVSEPQPNKVPTEPMTSRNIPPKVSCVDDTNADSVSTPRNSCLPDNHFRYCGQSCYMNPRMSVLPTGSKIPVGEQEQEDPPVAVFDPPDPTKIPMYDKNKVYSCSGEMSFEEIRAAKWLKQEKTIKLELKVSEQESIIAEQAAKIKLLEEKIKFLQETLIKSEPVQSSAVPLHLNATSSGTEIDNGCSPSDEPYGKEHENVVSATQTSSQKVGQISIEDKQVIAPLPVPQPNIEETSASTCVDPFDSCVNTKFLNSLNLPLDYYGNFYSSEDRINLDLKRKEFIKVGDISYLIEDMISEGSYGKVFIAVEQPVNQNTSKAKVALKVSNYVSNWEIYMCITLHCRMEKLKDPPDVSSSVMKVTSAHKYANAIIFTNELSHKGTLLDLVNNYKIKKSNLPELLAMYITWELLQIVWKMHKCQIIHADIKPDNVLIRDNVSNKDIINSLSHKTVLIKLIDFGRAIDLSFFEKGVNFSSTFKKDKCIEMIEKKPWVFQIDWFGLLNCVHVLLFADYMKVIKSPTNGRWTIQKKLQRRWDHTIWAPIFDELLNIPSCYQEPNIESHCNRIMTKLQQDIKNFKF